MKFTKNEKVEYEVCTLRCVMNVRHWEDCEIDGADYEDGGDLYGKSGSVWMIDIDLDTGIVKNWNGKKLKTHFKVCDEGIYKLLNSEGDVIAEIEDYVPSMLSPNGNGYGDYVIMDIDETGKIDNFKVDLGAFYEEEYC